MPTSDGQWIRSEKEILSILERLRERAAPITIQPDESASQLTTYIEAIDSAKQQILFDSPLPDFRHSLLDKRRLTLTTRYNGCLLTLADVLLNPVAGDTENRYLSALPKQLHLLQRREAYRAPVRNLLKIPITISHPAIPEGHLVAEQSVTLSGTLKDLSSSGCCVVFAGNQQESFSQMSSVSALEMVFPNGESRSLLAQIVRSHYVAEKELTEMGCLFVELSHPQEQFINKVVGDLQRDFIAHSRGNLLETPALLTPKTATSESITADLPMTEEVASVDTPVVLTTETPSNLWLASAPVDIKKAFASAETVIKACINSFRVDKGLPIEQAREACLHLLAALKQDRQGFVMLTRQRHLETYQIQHSISYAISFAEVVASQLPEHASDLLLEKILLGGLLHNIAQASLPEGLQHYEVLVTDKDRQQHIDELQRMIRQLEALKTLSHETLCIVRDFHERLDGSGIPNQKQDEQLGRVSKMAAVIYAHERLSHVWYQQAWYYHPLKAFKTLIDLPDQYHLPSVRALLKHYGKYPLGSLVQLSDQTLALVMRQDQQGQPTYLRVVYDLSFDSLIPPRDIQWTPESTVRIEKAANPLKYKISSQLLRLSLKR